MYLIEETLHIMKKKVLYLSNIPVPYRVRFFNQLACYCNLTVLYERRESANRDKVWANSEASHYQVEYLDGTNVGRESAFSFKIVDYVRMEWDVVIVGCYNTKVQMMAILVMRLFRIPFVINIDGEPFIDNSLKGKLKQYFLRGAKAYLIAGEKSADSLKAALGNNIVVQPYWFSSLSDDEQRNNSQTACERQENAVLVVGQYYDYKGMDVAYRAACLDMRVRYKFVGMGNRSELFRTDLGGTISNNVEVISFLQKEELEDEYKKCACLVLPSRQECWGLVVNEAASFGTPIVSTYGSGAAVEFILDNYPQYLAKPGDAKSLYDCIMECLQRDNTEYSDFLKKKSATYSIERSVRMHAELINSL